MKVQKLLGLLIVIFIIFGSVSIVGFQLSNDIHSILFVLGGASGYSFLKSRRNDWIKNLGNGAVYFG